MSVIIHTINKKIYKQTVNWSRDWSTTIQVNIGKSRGRTFNFLTEISDKISQILSLILFNDNRNIWFNIIIQSQPWGSGGPPCWYPRRGGCTGVWGQLASWSSEGRPALGSRGSTLLQKGQATDRGFRKTSIRTILSTAWSRPDATQGRL